MYKIKTSFKHAAASIKTTAAAARPVLGRLPGLAAARRHLSRKDLAFIAAAYAIPLPGTALFAAMIVGSRLGCGHLRRHLRPRLNAGGLNG